jgi:hypothetical protein
MSLDQLDLVQEHVLTRQGRSARISRSAKRACACAEAQAAGSAVRARTKKTAMPRNRARKPAYAMGTVASATCANCEQRRERAQRVRRQRSARICCDAAPAPASRARRAAAAPRARKRRQRGVRAQAAEDRKPQGSLGLHPRLCIRVRRRVAPRPAARPRRQRGWPPPACAAHTAAWRSRAAGPAQLAVLGPGAFSHLLRHRGDQLGRSRVAGGQHGHRACGARCA